MIEIKDLKKIYNKGKRSEQTAIDDLTLSLPDRGLVTILGESGCGKTTLLNAIGGLDTFEGGTITFKSEAGESVNRTGYDAKLTELLMSRHFGYIFQNYYLIEDESADYNIRLALDGFDLTDEEKEKRVCYVLAALGMEKYRKKTVSTLSGGQRQRISIARAVVKAPEVILADEPTGNLDEENTLKTMSILKALSNSCLVLLVSHEKRVAEFFSDRIITISSGKVVSDRTNIPLDTYEREDDANIYLGELTKHGNKNNGISVDLYTERNTEENIKITLAVKNGRVFVSAEGADVLPAGSDTGINILPGKRPVIDRKTIDEFSFELEKPKPADGKSGAEVKKLTLRNFLKGGKRKVLLGLVFIAAAVMITVALANLSGVMRVDEDSVITADKDYMRLDFTKVTALLDDSQREDILSFTEKYIEDDKNMTAVYVPDTSLYLKGEGFAQLSNVMQGISGFSFGDRERLHEDQVIYGKLPEGHNEAAVDRLVLKKLVRDKGVLSSFYKNEKDYIGTRLYAPGPAVNLVITAVVDTGRPDVYAEISTLCGLSKASLKVMTDSEYGFVSGNAETTKLNDGEILMREGLYSAKQSPVSYQFVKNGKEYYVSGTFSDEFGADFVVPESELTYLKDICISNDSTCMVMTDDMDSAAARLSEAAREYSSSFHLDTSVPYLDELSAYKEEHRKGLSTAFAFLFAFTLASLVMIFFTIKSNAGERTEEFTVVRLIGIRRKTIEAMYLYEILLFTCITAFPAILLSYIIINAINTMPALESGLFLPFWSIFVIMAAAALINSGFAILMVNGIITRPPAKLKGA